VDHTELPANTPHLPFINALAVAHMDFGTDSDTNVVILFLFVSWFTAEPVSESPTGKTDRIQRSWNLRHRKEHNIDGIRSNRTMFNSCGCWYRRI